MTNKEKIKVLNELISKYAESPSPHEHDLVFNTLKDIKKSIASIEEPVSDDLEEVSRNYADNEEYGDDVYFAIKAAFKVGAQWQKQKTVDHISEWITYNIIDYIKVTHHGGVENIEIDSDKLSNDLIQSMED